MGVFGIGVDLIDTKKMKKIISSKSGNHFLSSTFTEKEIGYANDDIQKLAAIFAAKEAAYKAFGTGWIDGKEVEVTRDEKGVPKIRFNGEMKKTAKRRKIGKTLLTISHTESCAVAVVVITSS